MCGSRGTILCTTQKPEWSSCKINGKGNTECLRHIRQFCGSFAVFIYRQSGIKHRAAPHNARLTALHGVAIETIEKGENIAEFTHW